MIGKTLTRKADKSAWTVTAYDEAQAAFTLTPVEFGSPIGLSADELRREFSGARSVSPPDPTDEVKGWKTLGASFERAVRRQRRGFDGVLTAEEILSGRARERAEQIAADEDALADYAVGLLPVSREVAAVLDEVIAAREAEADKPRRRRSKAEADENTLSAAEARDRLGHKV